MIVEEGLTPAFMAGRFALGVANDGSVVVCVEFRSRSVIV